MFSIFFKSLKSISNDFLFWILTDSFFSSFFLSFLKAFLCSLSLNYCYLKSNLMSLLYLCSLLSPYAPSAWLLFAFWIGTLAYTSPKSIVTLQIGHFTFYSIHLLRQLIWKTWPHLSFLAKCISSKQTMQVVSTPCLLAGSSKFTSGSFWS